jgi:hypothetical protein
LVQRAGLTLDFKRGHRPAQAIRREGSPHRTARRNSAAITRLIDRFARAMATMANILDPDVIVMGGGLSNIGRLYERIAAAGGKLRIQSGWTAAHRQKHARDSSGSAERLGYGRRRRLARLLPRLSVGHSGGCALPACGSTRILAHPELDRLSIAHLDCDAFYAAIEKRDDPS